MIIVDQFMSDHEHDENEADIKREMLQDETHEQQNDAMPKNIQRSMVNNDMRFLGNKNTSMERNVHKQSMLLKSFNKQEYNQMVSSMLDRRGSHIMSLAENRRNAKESIAQPTAEKTDNTRSGSIILAVGLLIHNIFEGISIGLAPSRDKLIVMMVAVCAHKTITAFSLGLSFLKSDWFDVASYCIMITFTVAGPIGSVIGFWLSASAPVVVTGIMMSLTCGTFLYISMTEVVSVEFSKVENKIIKILGFMMGLATFSVFVLLKDGD